MQRVLRMFYWVYCIGLAAMFFGLLAVIMGMAKEITMAMPDLPLKLESIAPSAVRPLVFGGMAAAILGMMILVVAATKLQRRSTPRN